MTVADMDVMTATPQFAGEVSQLSLGPTGRERRNEVQNPHPGDMSQPRQRTAGQGLRSIAAGATKVE